MGLARPIAARTRGVKPCSSKGCAFQHAAESLFPDPATDDANSTDVLADLGDWDIFMALLVEEALHTDRGFIETCSRIQATKAVFSPLQLLEGSVFWLLAHFGFTGPLMQRKSEEVMVPTEEGGAFQHAAGGAFSARHSTSEAV